MIRKRPRLKSILAGLAITALSLGSWANMVVLADNESVNVQAVTAVINVDSITSLSGAIDTVNANPNTQYTINVQDNISITSSTALTISNTAGVTIVSDMSLAGAPFTITKNSSNNRHFTVKGTLAFHDIILDGSGIGGGVRVTDGVFYLNDGAVIQNCYTRESTSGGAISGGKQMSPTHVEYTCDITIDGGIIRNNVAAGTNGGGAVYINGENNNFTMKRGTINDNKATSTSTGYGGAIVAYGPSDVTIEGGTISGNTAAGSGGGVYCNGAAAFTMTGGSITGNHSSGIVTGTSYGGGVYAGYGAVNMTGGIISGNTVKGPGGGIGIYSTSAVAAADINISGVTISDNIASNNGGGVFVSRTNSTSTTTVSVSNGIISGNNASNGGGIYVASSNASRSVINISNSGISGNKTPGSGGGVYGGSYSTIKINNSIISDTKANGVSAYNGGGIYGHTNSSIIVDGGKLIGNSASQFGGGIYGDTGSNITVTGGSTVERNEAGRNGGGIYASGSGITANNATITGNTAVSGHGGGIFGPAGCYIAVTDCRITSNSAPAGDGGGIYTADMSYAHLSSSDTTVYSGNYAKAAYLFTGTRYADIQSASVSIPGTYVLNNYDINYTGGALLNFYTVTYDANGGEGSHRDTGLASGSEYTVLSQDDTGIAYSGHIFQGWNTAPDGSGAHYDPGTRLTVTGDVILYAQWLPEPTPLPITYTVTYDANGGEGSHSDTELTLDSEYSILSSGDTGIANPGHIFQDWNTAPEGGGAHYDPGDRLTVAGDIILYAQWLPESTPLPITYTVTYDANGGEGSYRDTDLSLGAEYTVRSLDDTEIAYSGHLFQGWNTAPDGRGMYYPVDSAFTVSEDVMLFAQWSVISGGGVIKGTRRPYSHNQDLLIEIEENEVPLENTELTEIDENKVPLTGSKSNLIIVGLSCLFILGGLVLHHKSRLFQRK